MADDERDLMLWIAGDGWLGAYVDYARRVTDAPLAFHVGAGLTALATAVGSRVSWTGGGGRENWPNLYVLLMAPSGIFRKSTSVDLPAGLLERAMPGAVMEREFTPEKFVANLQEHPSSMIKEAEFGSLLERMKSSYMVGLKQRITELYDCIPEYGRGKAGMDATPIKIVRPSLNILAASTTTWLVESLNEMDMRSGFLPRFLMFSPTIKEPEPPGGYWAERQLNHENSLVRVLGQIGHCQRTHLVMTEVRDMLIAWDAKARRSFEDGRKPDDLSGLYSRLAHSVTKVGCLLTISDQTQNLDGRDLVMTAEVAQRAIALIDWVTESAERVMEESLVWEKDERKMQRILAMCGTEGIARREALRRMHMRDSEFSGLVDTLKARGELYDEQVATGGRFSVMLKRAAPEVVVSPNGHVPDLGVTAAVTKV